MASTRINNDKYYTPNSIAVSCVINMFNAIENDDPDFDLKFAIETAAGSGVFMKAFSSVTANQIPCFGSDLYPEAPESYNVVKQDYLKASTPYTAGTISIGNPPFGIGRERLYPKFIKKGLQSCNYVGFILPFSQFDNYWTNYAQGELIATFDLGEQVYSNSRVIQCAFNVYRAWTKDRPRPKKKFPSMEFILKKHFENEGIKPVKFEDVNLEDPSLNWDLNQDFEFNFDLKKWQDEN